MKRIMVAPALLLVLGASEAHAATFRYELSNSTAERAARDARESAAAIRGRLAGMGADVSVTKNRIRVSGVSGATARRLVEPEGELVIFDWEGSVIRSILPGRKGCYVETESTAPAGVGRTTKTVARRRARACKVGGEMVHGPKGNGWYALVRQEPITSDNLVNPRVGSDPATGRPVINFKLDERGRKEFAFITHNVARRGRLLGSAGHHIAFTVDRELFSTPVIDGDANPRGLTADNGLQIAGGFSRKRAKTLVKLIKNPLAAPLRRLR